MKYVGSKNRLSKDIVPIIQAYIDDNNIEVYYEPFVGGANIIDKIKCKTRLGSDINEYLIELWKQIQLGWNPLTEVDMSKEFYNNVKNNMDSYPKHIVALCGLCATYNAKWFGGYAGIVCTKEGTIRNYYNEAVRNLLRQKELIQDVIFTYNSYTDINPNNALIYCDPPYADTTKYIYDFDHDDYWEWVRKVSKNNIVLCSEYNAPDDFECIWEKELTTTLDKNSRSKTIEKLFMYKYGKQYKIDKQYRKDI